MLDAGLQFRFGDFVLSAERLTSSGRTVHLAPTPLRFLRTLVERGGAVVAKEELVSRVWAGSGVSDASLARSAYLVRSALDDLGTPARYVETVYGRGYRFVAPVTVVGAASPSRSLGWARELPGRDSRCVELSQLAAHHLARRTPRNLHASRQLFREAVALDPNHAPARAGLGEACLQLVLTGGVLPAQVREECVQALGAALALDPAFGPAHAMLATVHALLDDRPDEARREIELAYAGTGEPECVHLYAMWTALGVGDAPAAVRAAQRALDVNPAALRARAGRTVALFGAGRGAEALAQARASLDIEPDHPTFLQNMCYVGAYGGAEREALAAADRLAAMPGGPAPWRTAQAHVAARTGRRAQAVALLDGLWAIARREYVIPALVAAAELEIGRVAEAEAWLELAREQRCIGLPLGRVLPVCRRLAELPAYAAPGTSSDGARRGRAEAPVGA